MINKVDQNDTITFILEARGFETLQNLNSVLRNVGTAAMNSLIFVQAKKAPADDPMLSSCLSHFRHNRPIKQPKSRLFYPHVQTVEGGAESTPPEVFCWLRHQASVQCSRVTANSPLETKTHDP